VTQPTQITPPTEQTTDAAHRVDDAATPAPPQPRVESQPRGDSGSHLPAAELNWPKEVLAWTDALPADTRLILGIATLDTLRARIRRGAVVAALETLRSLRDISMGALRMARRLDAGGEYDALAGESERLWDLCDAYYDWLNAQERAAIRDGGPLEHLRDTREETDR
jgi:hypothetical protein